MKERLGGFFACLGLGTFDYSYCCAESFYKHPELPWFETGIYGGGVPLVGVVVFVVGAFWYLLFGFSKE
jgi:hypothetical protein